MNNKKNENFLIKRIYINVTETENKDFYFNEINWYLNDNFIASLFSVLHSPNWEEEHKYKDPNITRNGIYQVDWIIYFDEDDTRKIVNQEFDNWELYEYFE